MDCLVVEFHWGGSATNMGIPSSKSEYNWFVHDLHVVLLVHHNRDSLPVVHDRDVSLLGLDVHPINRRVEGEGGKGR